MKMKTITEKTKTLKNMNNSLASTPNTLYASKVLGKDIEIDNNHFIDTPYMNSLGKMWNQQHPVIHTWLVLSSISICFLSALLFILR